MFQHFTFENWEWAFTMLFSRAIRLRNLRMGESLAMVPYADLINHSCFSLAYIDAREIGDWLFKTGGEEVILYADRGYRRMEQVRDRGVVSVCLMGSALTPSSVLDLHFVRAKVECRALASLRICSRTEPVQLGRCHGVYSPADGIVCQGDC